MVCTFQKPIVFGKVKEKQYHILDHFVILWQYTIYVLRHILMNLSSLVTHSKWHGTYAKHEKAQAQSAKEKRTNIATLTKIKHRTLGNIFWWHRVMVSKLDKYEVNKMSFSSFLDMSKKFLMKCVTYKMRKFAGMDGSWYW